MKIQITATVSSNGYLLPSNTVKGYWPFRRKNTLSSLQKEADILLHKYDSLLSLLSEKQNQSDTTYLAEATPETIGLIKGLLLYHLADELILYILSAEADKGIAISDIVDMREWDAKTEHTLSQHTICRIYQYQMNVNPSYTM